MTALYKKIDLEKGLFSMDKMMYGFKKENKLGSVAYYSRSLPNGKFIVALIRKKKKATGDLYYVNITLRRENFQVGKVLFRHKCDSYELSKEILDSWVKKESIRSLYL